MHAFEYLKPKSIDEAISLMESLVASLRTRPSSMHLRCHRSQDLRSSDYAGENTGALREKKGKNIQ